MVGGAGAVAAAVPFVASFMPSERAKAAGRRSRPNFRHGPGEMRSFEWQGRPVWILNRTPQMLQSICKKTDGEVADPKSLRRRIRRPTYARNEYRSIKPEYFIAVGICYAPRVQSDRAVCAGRQLDAWH